MNCAAELDGERLVGARDEPSSSLVRPFVGELDLISVDDLLFEKAVFVADRKSRRGVSESRKRVHEAGGKSAESAVAESGIALSVVSAFKIEAHLVEDLAVDLLDTEIHHRVHERASDEELHTEIIFLFLLALLDFFAVSRPLFGEDVAYAHDDGSVDLVSGRLVRGDAVISYEFVFKCLSECFLLQCVVCHCLTFQSIELYNPTYFSADAFHEKSTPITRRVSFSHFSVSR